MRKNLKERIEKIEVKVDKFKDKYPFTYGCIIGLGIGLIAVSYAKNTDLMDKLDEKFDF